jgi:hypothetical protein
MRETLAGGFCMAGYWLPDRTPMEFEIKFDPLGDQPVVSRLQWGKVYLWGASDLMRRLMMGIADQLKAKILASGLWRGSVADFEEIVEDHRLHAHMVPIRDAVDFMHAGILCTIKSMKFFDMNQTCGGPIELAVIATDRSFRWVRHKDWASAIEEYAR